MRTPMHIVDPRGPSEPTPDMRTWGQRNAKAIGTIIGSALATMLVGTGGLTGLAHVAGIATTRDNDELKAKIAAVEKHVQESSQADETHFKLIEGKLDKALTVTQVSPAKRPRKPKPASEE